MANADEKIRAQVGRHTESDFETDCKEQNLQERGSGGDRAQKVGRGHGEVCEHREAKTT